MDQDFISAGIGSDDNICADSLFWKSESFDISLCGGDVFDEVVTNNPLTWKNQEIESLLEISGESFESSETCGAPVADISMDTNVDTKIAPTLSPISYAVDVPSTSGTSSSASTSTAGSSSASGINRFV
jgi:hypothetical protein